MSMTVATGGKRKSKTNPKGICELCGKKIINKERNAKYGSCCDTIIRHIHQCLCSWKYGVTKRAFPFLKIRIVMTIEHKRYKNKVKFYVGTRG